jgi:hypothetical protein
LLQLTHATNKECHTFEIVFIALLKLKLKLCWQSTDHNQYGFVLFRICDC